jgi:hypothetical protein
MNPEILASLIGTLIGAVTSIIVALIQIRSKKSEDSPQLFVPEGYKTHRPQRSKIWYFILPFALLGGIAGYFTFAWFHNTSGPCIVNDFSDENSTRLNWSISSNSDSDGTTETSINNGKYVWSMNALTPILYTQPLLLLPGVVTQNRNYEVEVDIQKTSGPDSVEYGFMLNQEAQLKQYAILISPAKQKLWIGKRTPEQWVTKFENTFGYIDLVGVNNLRVVKHDSDYQVYINGNSVAIFSDSEYTNGTVKLVAEISEINSDVILEIDNFKLCNIP